MTSISKVFLCAAVSAFCLTGRLSYASTNTVKGIPKPGTHTVYTQLNLADVTRLPARPAPMTCCGLPFSQLTTKMFFPKKNTSLLQYVLLPIRELVRVRSLEIPKIPAKAEILPLRRRASFVRKPDTQTLHVPLVLYRKTSARLILHTIPDANARMHITKHAMPPPG